MAPINICSYAVLIIYSGSKDSSQLLNNLIKTRAVLVFDEFCIPFTSKTAGIYMH
jgi:hypothetical protein